MPLNRPDGPVSRIPITEWAPTEPPHRPALQPFDARRNWYTFGQHDLDTAPDSPPMLYGGHPCQERKFSVARGACTCDAADGWRRCPHHGSLEPFDDPERDDAADRAESRRQDRQADGDGRDR